MKHLFVCFSLLCMILLSACGGGEAAPSGQPLPSPSAETAAPPSADPMTDSVPDKGAPPSERDPAVRPGESAETVRPSAGPTSAPSAPPSSAAPTPAPTPAPSDAPAPEPEPESALAASDVFSAVADAVGTMPAGMEPGASVLEALYGLSADDLEDFCFRVPQMSANVTEFLVAKVKSGRMDDVKAACLQRQSDLAAGAALYPENGALVEDYRLETSGDWLLFCVTDNADAAAAAFQNAVK